VGVPADASRLVSALQNYAAQTMTAVGPLVANAVKADHRTPRGKTLDLVGSITSEGLVSATGIQYTVRVVAPVIQAATTNFGARPHTITPRSGGVLAFNWPKAGGTVFLRSVNHPGNQAKNWWEPAVRDAYRTALPQAARTATF
jgi:hypothetical protein